MYSPYMTAEDWRKQQEIAAEMQTSYGYKGDISSSSSQGNISSSSSQDQRSIEKPTPIEAEAALSHIPIGSRKLLRLLYVTPSRNDDINGTPVVAYGVIIVPAGTQEILVETLAESQFAFYVWDVICLNDAIVDVYITAGIVGGAVGGGIQCSLIKRRNFLSPDKTDVILLIDSVVGGDSTLAYRVYRIAGLR